MNQKQFKFLQELNIYKSPKNITKFKISIKFNDLLKGGQKRQLLILETIKFEGLWKMEKTCIFTSRLKIQVTSVT